MRQIFAHATLVSVWLGEQEEASILSCELIEALAEYYASDKFELDNPIETHPNLEEAEWNSLILFFQSPWFNRVWVFQEAVMARRITFI
jgi:hypothetical protein